jgi:ankyrin repeat protein
VRRLLDSGANVNAADTDGSTALMAAAIDGQQHLATVLLEAGADIATRDCRQQTASMLARKNGHVALATRLEDESRAELRGSPGATAQIARIPAAD